MTEESLIEALRQPEAFPWPVSSVDVVETHISWVFLAGERVVKVKRPVGYSFVDYTTLEKRHEACLDEVRLNRLLTDGVYLDAVPITCTSGTYRVGGDGEPVEWATLMSRLPADRMLDVVLRHGDAPPDLAGRLADRLVPFHLGRAPRCDGDVATVSREMNGVITDNLAELRPFRGDPLGAAQLDLVARAMQTFLDEHGSLLETRVRSGWTREGHGDLRCEHVCLEEDGSVQVYDCVEFNRDLRCADIASDLAFLLMDLHRLGAPAGTIDELLRRYRDAGADLPMALLRYYWVHRALVRAKVACLRLPDAEGEAWAALAYKAVDYLHVATRQAITTRPALVAMTGLSGTGKSTVAKALAQALGAEYVASDVVRKELASTTASAAAAWGEGIYTGQWTDATYGQLMERGERVLRDSRVALLDATFLDAERREQAAASARKCGVPFVLVETVCEESVVVERLVARQARGDSRSDASVDTYRRQRAAHLESPPAVPSGTIAITVDTTPSGPSSLDPAFTALEDAGLVEARIRDDGVLVRGGRGQT
jgi:uncharacterized protein